MARGSRAGKISKQGKHEDVVQNKMKTTSLAVWGDAMHSHRPIAMFHGPTPPLEGGGPTGSPVKANHGVLRRPLFVQGSCQELLRPGGWEWMAKRKGAPLSSGQVF